MAVNLARLGYAVTLLSAVGNDPLGSWLLDQTSKTGVDIRPVILRPEPTGMFVTVGPKGGESWCVADTAPLDALETIDLEKWRNAVNGARAVVSDANLAGPAQQTVASLAGATPRILLATSPQKAVRLRPVLAGAAMIVCNRQEALALTGLPPTLGWQALGTALLTEGVERVVLTQGAAGIAVLTSEEAVMTPAAPGPVIDPSGAGDGVAAAAVHAYLAGLDPLATGSLAASAAAVVVASEDNTPVEFRGVIAL